jgi:hypothetical protein
MASLEYLLIIKTDNGIESDTLSHVERRNLVISATDGVVYLDPTQCRSDEEKRSVSMPCSE